MVSTSCSDQSDAPQQNEPTSSSSDTIIRVGAERAYKTPGAAFNIARDGDIIEIDQGVYRNEAVVITKNNLTIRGIDRPHIQADGAHAEGKGTWVIKGNDILIDNLEFSGAKVPHGNGAAIRFEGTNLTLRNCYIHHNENGFLCGENPASEIIFEYCEFAHNGTGDGFTHNIYVGAVGRFILRCSYIHHARIGHNVKSRAAENLISYNRIMDETDGNSSYAVDLPNGGRGFVIGNVMQQGLRTDNSTIISYGAEGQTHKINELYVINNTLVNYMSDGLFVGVLSNPTTTRIVNNIFSGAGGVVAPGAVQQSNIRLNSGFINAAQFDYRLTPDSPAIDAGMNLDDQNELKLSPDFQYVHQCSCEQRPRDDKIDAGAFELAGKSQ